MNKTAIFVLYHKNATAFKSEIFKPLQTGAARSTQDFGFLRDDSGDNISAKNHNYGELTGWYWVWKNWLPKNPEFDRIGFCHYRRFLDPFGRPVNAMQPFHPYPVADFKRRFATWNDSEIDTLYHTADMVLPKRLSLRKSRLYDRKYETVYTQYAKAHPVPDMDAFLEMLVAESAECASATRHVFGGHEFRDCLMFVMRRDMFESLAAWTFRLLFALEKKSNWSRYTDYMDVRVPAYIFERAFNVWLALHPSATVLERDSIRLVDKCATFSERLRLRLHFLRHPPADARSIAIPDCLRQ